MDEDGLPTSAIPIPHSFRCPITQDVMTNPVAAVDGSVYQREAIETWFRTGRRTSPVTNLQLPSLVVTPESALRRAIEEYVALRPELVRPERDRRSYQEWLGSQSNHGAG